MLFIENGVFCAAMSRKCTNLHVLQVYVNSKKFAWSILSTVESL
jgi:hypothetical protein